MILTDSALKFSINFLLLGAVLAADENFYLHENEVTVKCENATLDGSGLLNGVSYTKRNKNQITESNALNTCTSGIYDMGYLFADKPDFNQNISHWNTSQVTNMQSMFSAASSFNHPIGDWDTSQVKTIDHMFNNASNFNLDLSRWCVSNIAEEAPGFSGGSGLVSKTSLNGVNVQSFVHIQTR